MMSTAADFALARARVPAPPCPDLRPQLAQMVAVMFGGYFLPLPVHARRALVVDLHAIHADVALAGFRVARDHAGQSDEAARVFRPALQDGKIEEREIVAFDDFFAGAGGNCPGKELAHLGQHGQHLYFVEKALRRLDVHEGANAVGDFVEGVDFESAAHAAGRAELIDEKLLAGIAFEVFKQQRLAAYISALVASFSRRGRRSP